MASYIWFVCKQQQHAFSFDREYISNTRAAIIAKGNIIEGIEAKE